MSAEFATAILFGVTVLVALSLAGPLGSYPLEQNRAPDVDFDRSYDGETLTFTYTGGDVIFAGSLLVRSDAIKNSGGPLSETSRYEPEDILRQGDRIVIGAGHYEWTDSSDTGLVRIIWVSYDGESSATLAEWEGPEVE